MRDEHFIERHGKRYVLYAGLLEEFHEQADGWADATPAIMTQLEQVPSEANGNVAIVRAEVGFREDGNWVYGPFGGIGDASPANVGRNIAPHIVRMAETRAKARALRDAINVGVTAFEELSDGDAAPPQRSEAPARRSATNSRGDTYQEASTGKPREKASDSSNGKAEGEPDENGDITQTQEKRVRWLIMQLVESTDQTEEEALAKLEEDVGHPIDSWNEGEARHQIGRLQKALDSRGGS